MPDFATPQRDSFRSQAMRRVLATTPKYEAYYQIHSGEFEQRVEKQTQLLWDAYTAKVQKAAQQYASAALSRLPLQQRLNAVQDGIYQGYVDQYRQKHGVLPQDEAMRNQVAQSQAQHAGAYQALTVTAANGFLDSIELAAHAAAGFKVNRRSMLDALHRLGGAEGAYHPVAAGVGGIIGSFSDPLFLALTAATEGAGGALFKAAEGAKAVKGLARIGNAAKYGSGVTKYAAKTLISTAITTPAAMATGALHGGEQGALNQTLTNAALNIALHGAGEVIERVAGKLSKAKTPQEASKIIQEGRDEYVKAHPETTEVPQASPEAAQTPAAEPASPEGQTAAQTLQAPEATPEAMQQTSPATATPPQQAVPKHQPFRVPFRESAKPRYKSQEVQFENDLDRAAYIIRHSAGRRSKGDADYLKAVMDYTGLNESQARALGENVNAKLKTLAAQTPEGEPIIVPPGSSGFVRSAPAIIGKVTPKDESPEVGAGEPAEIPPPVAPESTAEPSPVTPDESSAEPQGVPTSPEHPQAYAAANARMAELRQSWDLPGIDSPTRKSAADMLADARAQGIPERAMEIARSVNVNPRQLSDIEVTGMVEHLQVLDNKFKRLNQAIAESTDPAQIEGHAVELQRTVDDLGAMSEADMKAGTEWGRAGVARRFAWLNDMEFSSLIARGTVAHKAPLSKDQIEMLQKLVEENTKLKTHINRMEQRVNEQTAQKSIEKTIGADSYRKMSREYRAAKLEESRSKYIELMKAGCPIG